MGRNSGGGAACSNTNTDDNADPGPNGYTDLDSNRHANPNGSPFSNGFTARLDR
jgi:hypothetical protein